MKKEKYLIVRNITLYFGNNLPLTGFGDKLPSQIPHKYKICVCFRITKISKTRSKKIVLTENATEFHFVGRLQKQYTTDLS